MESKGGFPLSRPFYVRTRVRLTCVNKLEAMYKRSRVNVKVEPGRHVKMKRQWNSTLRDERPRILKTQGRSCKEISI